LLLSMALNSALAAVITKAAANSASAIPQAGFMVDPIATIIADTKTL